MARRVFLGHASEKSEAGRGTVLVVEADPQWLREGRLLVAKNGHRVLPASTTEQGLRHVVEDSVDLIIFDAGQADRHGMLSLVKKRSDLIPIILTVSEPVAPETALAIERWRSDVGLEIIRVLTKPFVESELCAALERSRLKKPLSSKRRRVLQLVDLYDVIEEGGGTQIVERPRNIQKRNPSTRPALGRKRPMPSRRPHEEVGEPSTGQALPSERPAPSKNGARTTPRRGRPKALGVSGAVTEQMTRLELLGFGQRDERLEATQELSNRSRAAWQGTESEEESEAPAVADAEPKEAPSRPPEIAAPLYLDLEQAEVEDPAPSLDVDEGDIVRLESEQEIEVLERDGAEILEELEQLLGRPGEPVGSSVRSPSFTPTLVSSLPLEDAVESADGVRLQEFGDLSGRESPWPDSGLAPRALGVSLGQLAAEGSLQHISPDQVFQLATQLAGPVCCQFEHGEASVQVFFRGHDVAFASQQNLPEGFTLGRLLVAAGALGEDGLTETLGALADSSAERFIGETLVEKSLIRERDLRQALARQTEELVYEVIRFARGRFKIMTGVELPKAAEAACVSIPVQHLLLEGVRRLDEWQRFVQEVGDLGAVVARVNHRDEDGVLKTLSSDDRAVLDHVDGARTIEDVVRQVQRPTFEVLSLLRGLIGRELVSCMVRVGSA